MDQIRRKLFNAAYGPELVSRMMNHLQQRVGPVAFRVAETPLLVTAALRDRLVADANAILEQISAPALIDRLRGGVPERYLAPDMDRLPNTAQVDFALVQGREGLEGRLIELQGFPSLYALMPMMAEAWSEALRGVPGLAEDWTCCLGRGRAETLELLRRTLLGGCAPGEVVMLDVEPPRQKTWPDFVATQRLFGIDPVGLHELELEGRRLFRRKDGRRVQVRRIYNRVVPDELEVKRLRAPFDWRERLEVTWCSHPNWFFVWSKACLPLLRHPAVPPARLLSELASLPRDLSGYVLKPLFSFAGQGVVMDVTREAIEAVPASQRHRWMLQEKIEYAPAITTPDGQGVKAEVRVMFLRPPDEPRLRPAQLLVRLSRGRMLGVDHNKGQDWVGGSVGLWPATA